MQYSSHKAWPVHIKLAMLYILLDNYFVYSCKLPPRDECGKDNSPTNKTNIVDLKSTGCNQTHVWISWSWATPTGCAIEKVVINEYSCYLEDSSQHKHSNRKHFWPTPGGEKSKSYYSENMWNSTPMKCNIDGYFEMEDSCEQKLSPVMTCSKSVQPTSISSVPVTSSSLPSPIVTTVQMTSIMTTIQLTPSIIPKVYKVSSQTHSENIILWITVICMVTLIVVLLLTTASVVMMIKRWKNPKQFFYYNKNQRDFKPNFTPVIPDEVVFKGETSSTKSTIAPLEKTSESTLESIDGITNVTTDMQRL